jgi:hypothetical protein
MKKLTLRLLTAVIFTSNTAAVGARKFSPEQISLPPGFKITIFADNIPNARSITSGPEGVFFVGSRNAGKSKIRQHRTGGSLHAAGTGARPPCGLSGHAVL